MLPSRRRKKERSGIVPRLAISVHTVGLEVGLQNPVIFFAAEGGMDGTQDVDRVRANFLHRHVTAG